MSNLQEFYNYVLSFYGAGGLYPMSATLDLIAHKQLSHTFQILELKGSEFCGDSVDRECVRDFVNLQIQTFFSQTNLMKYEVKLYVGGKVFTESVEAVNQQDARVTALARNPTAKVIGVNAKF
jgi:hypothetical protein